MKISILLILFLSVTSVTFAQRKNDSIIYIRYESSTNDFEVRPFRLSLNKDGKMKYYRPSKIVDLNFGFFKYNPKFYALRIDSTNTALYKIDTDVSFYTKKNQIPEALKNYMPGASNAYQKLPPLQKFEDKKTKELIVKNNRLEILQHNQSLLSDKLSDLNNKTTQLKQNKNFLLKTKSFESSEKIQEINISLDETIKQIGNTKEDLKQIRIDIDKEQLDIIELEKSIHKDSLDKELNNIKNQYNLLLMIHNQTQELINDEYIKSSAISGTGKSIKENILNNFQNIYDWETISNVPDSLELIVKKVYMDFSTNVALYKSLHKITEANYQTLFTIAEMEQIITERKAFIFKCPEIITAYIQNKTFIQTKKNKMHGDYMSAKIVLNRSPFGEKPDTLSHTTLFFRRHYCRLGFSGGFFANNLANPSYIYTDTAGNYQRNNNSKFDLSIGALVHYNYVIRSWLKVGPVAGASVSIFDAKTKFLMGGAVTFGRRNEICISGGAALSNNAQAPAYFNTKTDVGAGVSTYDKPTWGGFVGISYALFSK